MSRRESLVGGEVVAEDAAEQAEKKRKQDEQDASWPWAQHQAAGRGGMAIRGVTAAGGPGKFIW